jgi:hypothetical protein
VIRERSAGGRDLLGGEAGTTLIETVVACGILLVVASGLAGLAGMATSITENEGHLNARTTEYAVDKMEQLFALAYGDEQSNTTVFPSVTSGGMGLAPGGSADPAAPTTGYADYLDYQGNPLCSVAAPCTASAPDGWYYVRVWWIEPAAANMKRITVTSTVRTSVGGALKARSTVVALKTNCPSGC